MADTITDEVKRQVIRDQLVFAPLESDDQNALADLLREKSFPAGQTIVTEGDPVDMVYMILSGTADVRHVRVKDEQLVHTSLATLGPGQSIGLSATGFYSLTGMRTATVVAITDLTCLQLSVPAFHGFALANSRVKDALRKNNPDSNMGD